MISEMLAGHGKEGEKKYEILVEDYVLSYLKREADSLELSEIFFYGRREENGRRILVYGAGRERDIAAFARHEFLDELLCRLTQAGPVFLVRERDGDCQMHGFQVFYESNEAMQRYLIQWTGRKRAHARRGAAERTDAPKTPLSAGDIGKRRPHSAISLQLCLILVTLVAIVISSANSYDKMEQLSRAARDVFFAIENQEAAAGEGQPARQEAAGQAETAEQAEAAGQAETARQQETTRRQGVEILVERDSSAVTQPAPQPEESLTEAEAPNSAPDTAANDEAAKNEIAAKMREENAQAGAQTDDQAQIDGQSSEKGRTSDQESETQTGGQTEERSQADGQASEKERVSDHVGETQTGAQTDKKAQAGALDGETGGASQAGQTAAAGNNSTETAPAAGAKAPAPAKSGKEGRSAQTGTEEAGNSAQKKSDKEGSLTAQTGEKNPAPEENTEALSRNVTRYYEVKRGDTLNTISQKIYGDLSRVDKICELNQIKDPDKIRFGQKIILP